MNIFYLDSDPQLAAQYQCNKHVVKQILESMQLLCGPHHICNTPFSKSELCYKLTHKNHPCSIWVRNRGSNYFWLWWHAYYLCEEYLYRYNKRHICEYILEYLRDYCADLKFETTVLDMLNPPQCMPEEYKNPMDCVQAYRNYYKYKQTVISMKWTKRNKPEWL